MSFEDTVEDDRRAKLRLVTHPPGPRPMTQLRLHYSTVTLIADMRREPATLVAAVSAFTVYIVLGA